MTVSEERAQLVDAITETCDALEELGSPQDAGDLGNMRLSHASLRELLASLRFELELWQDFAA